MNTIKRVCIFGVGGVGGYFGAKMTAAVTGSGSSDIEIHFIARGAHLNAIQSNGITLETAEGAITGRPASAISDISRVPRPDLILLCVKSYDLQKALTDIQPIVRQDTIIIPLLNGADIYDRIRQTIHTGVVLPACVYVGTHIASPGVIEQRGGDGKILLGLDPQRGAYSPRPLMDFFKAMQIDFQWQDDPFPAIWGKYLFIAAFGMVTVHRKQPLGELLADGKSRSLLESIMQEILAVAVARGVQLADDIIPRAIAKGERFPLETKTSYQRDVESKGRVNEGDIYGKTILRLGRELEVPTPVTRSVQREIDRQLARSAQ